MDTNCRYISYESTGYFSKLMIDYVKGDEKLKPFYKYAVSIEGIKAAIEARKQFNNQRELLVSELREQYKDLSLSEKQENNLHLLLQDNTFTTCTAHQPNIFTGPLYFIYKILHAVKLADVLKGEMPEYNFVPFYYMGSEDADLDELGHIFINGEKLEWQTKQTGAVGRMKVDKQLIQLIDRIAGEIGVDEHGNELISLLRSAYREGVSIQNATLSVVHELFKKFGLLVVIPDNANLKKAFNPVIKKELTEQFSSSIVHETTKSLGEQYKVQAGGRELNLFYLTENRRDRIEKSGNNFKIVDQELTWSEDEVLKEVDEHPERFSANVILRGAFQETILPNIAFIGGGGEIAYWLELQNVFEACGVPYPVLVVRNSLLLFNEEQEQLAKKLSYDIIDLFKPTIELVNRLVTRETSLQLTLDGEKERLNAFYDHIKQLTSAIDVTLAEHASALQTQALEKILALEKKMLRAEKRKFAAQQRQIEKLRKQLFPNNSLQERVENFSTFYAKHGKELLTMLYQHSLGLEQEFGILKVG